MQSDYAQEKELDCPCTFAPIFFDGNQLSSALRTQSLKKNPGRFGKHVTATHMIRPHSSGQGRNNCPLAQLILDLEMRYLVVRLGHLRHQILLCFSKSAADAIDKIRNILDLLVG